MIFRRIHFVIARSDSDEAIQFFCQASGLLRFARNDDATLWIPGQALTRRSGMTNGSM
jgi:hypothetical protein